VAATENSLEEKSEAVPTSHGYTTKNLDVSINSYLNDNNARRAIIIAGDWGSGKTTRIKKWISENTRNTWIERAIYKKFRPAVYVSAFGIRSSQQLKDAISHKSLSLSPLGIVVLLIHASGKLILSALGGNLTLNLNFFKKWARRPSVIIIDDMERISGNIYEVFGQINEYIEDNNTKIVLVADIKRLKKIDEENYLEKIADQVINVPINHQEMARLMTKNQTASGPSRFFFNKHRENKFSWLLPEIVSAFEDSKTNNYRSLQSAINNAHRIYKICPAENSQNHEHIKSLIYAIVSYTIEHKEGRLTEEDINAITSRNYFLPKVGKIPHLDKYNRHSITNTSAVPISTSLITDVVVNNFENHSRIREALHANPLLKPRNLDDWEIIWRSFSANEELLKKAVASQQDGIENLKYKDTGIVLHVFANKLFLSEASIIKDSYSSICAEASAYIDKLFRSEDLIFHAPSSSEEDFIDHSSYKGLGYPGPSYPYSKEFNDIRSYLFSKYKEMVERRAEKHISKVFSDLDKYFDEVLLMLRSGHSDDFYNERLHKVDPSRLAKQLQNLDAEKRFSIGLAIYSRIIKSHTPRLNEKNWAESLKNEILELISEDDPYKAHSLRQFAKFSLTERQQ